MQNYFALFGLKESMQIDLTDLSARYRDLQRAVHPDRHANSADNERLLSVSRAAELNDAYQTLKDPVLRAKYLWQRRGGHWQDERTIADPTFLFAQIEWREQIEQAEAQRNVDALQLLTQRLRSDLRSQENHLANTFSDLDRLNLEMGRVEIQKLMFFRKLQSEAEQRLQTLEEM